MKVWKKFWVMAGALSGWGGVKRVELLPFDKNPDDSKTAPARASRGEKKRRPQLIVGAVRVRMVEYTPGYLADHWCVKGHVLLCTAGELHTELEDGRTFVLKAGMSYQVADNAEPHRSSTATGATLFIVD